MLAGSTLQAIGNPSVSTRMWRLRPFTSFERVLEKGQIGTIRLSMRRIAAMSMNVSDV